MGESPCLMHSFSYDTRIPNEPNNNQGNHVHAVGESISFGRFMSESLGSETWSNVPHKRYVEEAKSYAQPGSVAEKKAFFEAHYKKIAAQKAAAAALLEQEKAAAAAHQVNDTIQTTHDSETTILSSHESITDRNTVAANSKNTKSSNSIENFEDNVSVSVDSRTSQTTRPLLKSKSNTDQEVTQPMIKRKPTIGRKPSRIPPSPTKYIASMHLKKHNTNTLTTMDKRRSTPRSLEGLMNSSYVKESCKLTSPDVRKTQRSKQCPSVHTTPKRSAFVNGANKQPLGTPSSVNRRMGTPVHSSAAGSKSGGQKWPILSAVSKSLSAYKNKLQSPTISSPFVLRTEDRAIRRKQKLEEKFNEKEAQMQQQAKLKEKAETEFRRLRKTFCFKARPLPDFYKTPEANPKSLASTSTTKNKSSRRLWKNNDQNPIQHPLFSVAKTSSHENISPNVIQYPSLKTHKSMR